MIIFSHNATVVFSLLQIKLLLAFATVLQIQNDICWNSKCFRQKTTFGQEKCTKVADRFKLWPILEIPQNPPRF